MKPIPSEILAAFEAVLKKKAVPAARHANYRKWLVYYLDFKDKYSLPESRSEDVRTTMIYTHCVPSKTIKEVKSPLDF